MDEKQILHEKKKFGKHIVNLRNRIPSKEYPNRTISQQELSDQSDNVSKKTIGEIERGDANPTFEVLLKLSKSLKVSMKELFNY